MEHDPDELKALITKFSSSPAEAQALQPKEICSPDSASSLPAHLQAEPDNAPESLDALAQSEEAGDLRMQISRMELPQKLKLALFGNSICRTLLIRDGSKIVPQFVLKNPKLTVKEIEEFSKNPHLSDLVLRAIADSKMWMKSAVVKYNIVTNPKTPQDVALKWLRYLQSHEIKRIAKSKNLPQVIATSAKKLATDIRS